MELVPLLRGLVEGQSPFGAKAEQTDRQNWRRLWRCYILGAMLNRKSQTCYQTSGNRIAQIWLDLYNEAQTTVPDVYSNYYLTPLHRKHVPQHDGSLHPESSLCCTHWLPSYMLATAISSYHRLAY